MEKYVEQNGVLVPEKPRLILGGTYHGIQIRDGKVIDEWEEHNLIVNQGLDHILSTEFCGTTQIQSWYLAPFDNNYVPVATDTAASISANAGEITGYSGSGRLAFTPTESAQQATNAASPATFTFTAPFNIYGMFLISSQAYNSTAGVLFAAAQFATPKPVAIADQLVITYVIGGQSA